MAMGALQQITAAGVSAALATPLSTETVALNDDIILHVKNASGSPITVTLTDNTLTAAGSVATNPTVSIPATTGDKYIFVNPLFANTTTGLITVGFSSTTSVTAEWLRM
jgi:hypothetical protein